MEVPFEEEGSGLLGIEDLFDGLEAPLSPQEEKRIKLQRLRELRRLQVQTTTNVNKHFQMYRDDPVGFCRDILGENLWSKQVEIMESVKVNKYTSVRSCHASGKSFTAARVVCWWLSTRPIGSAFAVTTAPTYNQVKAILWREIHRAHNKAGLPGRLNLTEWMMGDELVAFGRKPADYDTEAFQGIHAREVLVVLDEASGIPLALWDAAETILTSNKCRELAIGNPDDPTGMFAQSHQPDSGYHSIRIRAEDTPNFTGEVVPEVVSESLIDPDWVEDKKRRWGMDSPLYISKIMAEFPEDTADNLIPLSWIQRAQENTLYPDAPIELGVDVARFGDDETVIFVRRGPVARIFSVTVKQDTMTTVNRILYAANETGASVVKVDEIGVGAGVVDRLKEIGGLTIMGLNAGRPPADRDPKRDEDYKKRFMNARAQWFWNLRERFEKGLIDIDGDEELRDQLANIKFKVSIGGKIQIESKDDMKARGLKSPDRADAMAILFASEQIAGKPKGKLVGVRRW